MSLPPSLQCEKLLAAIRALDAQFQAAKQKGHFTVQFDYDEQGVPTLARVVAPTMYFDLGKA